MDLCITLGLVVVVIVVLAFLRELVRDLRRGPHPKREPYTDDVLGACTPCRSGWTAQIVNGDDRFELEFAGGREPDSAVLAHARQIVGDYQSFKRLVMERMDVESREYPPDVKRELAGLKIALISLSGAGEGMIFFRGSLGDVGAWRFDYIKGEPTGLGCDT